MAIENLLQLTREAYKKTCEKIVFLFGQDTVKPEVVSQVEHMVEASYNAAEEVIAVRGRGSFAAAIGEYYFAQACYHLALVRRIQEKYADALPWYRKALAIAPHDAHIKGDYSKALWRSGKKKEAIKQLEEARTIIGNSSEKAQFDISLAQLKEAQYHENNSGDRDILSLESAKYFYQRGFDALFYEEGKTPQDMQFFKKAMEGTLRLADVKLPAVFWVDEITGYMHYLGIIV